MAAASTGSCARLPPCRSATAGRWWNWSPSTLSAAVCPDLKGQVTSAVDKRSGKELLAVADAETGYRDMFSIPAQIWLPVPVAGEAA